MQNICPFLPRIVAAAPWPAYGARLRKNLHFAVGFGLLLGLYRAKGERLRLRCSQWKQRQDNRLWTVP